MIDDDIFTAMAKKALGVKPSVPKVPSDTRAEALKRAANKLGVDPADLGSIISFESAGSFDPHKVGGEGGKYKGLIQFGPDEQKTYYKPNDTFESQVEDGVVRFFQDRFKKVGRDTRGASLEDLYTTVIAGNPNANRDAKDSFGTSARSGSQRILKEHRPKVLQQFFGGTELGKPQQDDIFTALAKRSLTTPSQPQDDIFTAMAKSSLAQPQKPVTESLETIQAQIASAADPKVKTRYGVLTTDVSQDQVFGNTDGFAMFNTPQGNLWVNVDKAKKQLKLKSPKEIGDFIAKNPNALTRILGIAENVGNATADKHAVTARDPQTDVELASAAVTTPDKVVEQTKSYAEQFPGATIETTTTDDVAQRRAEQPIDFNKPVEEPTAPVAPLTQTDAEQMGLAPAAQPQPTQFDERSFNEANAYLKSQGQPQLTREQYLAAQQGFGKDVTVLANVNAPKAQPVAQSATPQPKVAETPVEAAFEYNPNATGSYADQDLNATAKQVAAQTGIDESIVRSYIKQKGYSSPNESESQREEQAKQGIKQRRRFEAPAIAQLKAYAEQSKGRQAEADLAFKTYQENGYDDVMSEIAVQRDLGILTQEETNAKIDAYRKLIERNGGTFTEKGRAGKEADDKSPAYSFDPRYGVAGVLGFKGVRDFLFGDGSVDADTVEKGVQADIKKYGSVEDALKAYKKQDDEVKFSREAGTGGTFAEAAKTVGRYVAKLPATVGELGAVALDLNPLISSIMDTESTRKSIMNATKQYRDAIDADLALGQNPAYKADFVANQLADTVAQLGTQAILTPLTGGVSLALPIAEAGTSQYRQADEKGADQRTRLGAFAIGGILAVPEVLLQAKYFKGLTPPKMQAFFNNVKNGIIKRLGGKVAKEEAEVIAQNTVLGMAKELGKRGVTNIPTEYIQERGEDFGNELYEKATYNPNLKWKDIFVPSSEKVKGYMAAGIGGGFGAVSQTVIEQMTNTELAKAEDVLPELFAEFKVSEAKKDAIRERIKAERERRVNLPKDAQTKVQPLKTPVEPTALATDKPVEVQGEAVEPSDPIKTVLANNDSDVSPEVVEPTKPVSSTREKAKKRVGAELLPDEVETERKLAKQDEVDKVSEMVGEVEHGKFKTGKPVTFEFLRNTEKSPRDVNNTFAQDQEPAGRYMIERDASIEDRHINTGWESGTITFEHPLVIDFGKGLYQDNTNWKQRLAKQYNATGKRLTKKLLAAGYDGIVTVRDGDTKEIIDLRVVGERKPQPAPPETQGKEPWQMTREEFRLIGIAKGKENATQQPEKWYERQADRNHKLVVEQAVKQGKPVPPEVLADYPDLQKRAAITARKAERADAARERVAGRKAKVTPTVKAKEDAPFTPETFAEAGYKMPGGLANRGVVSLTPRGNNRFDVKLANGQLLSDVLITKQPKGEDAVDNQSLLTPSDKMQIAYNGKMQETDLPFKDAAMKVAVNLKTGEKGYVKDADGKVYELTSSSKRAKLLPEKLVANNEALRMVTDPFTATLDALWQRQLDKAAKTLQQRQKVKLEATTQALQTEPSSVDEMEMDGALQTARDGGVLPDFVEFLRKQELSADQIDQVNVWITDEDLGNAPLRSTPERYDDIVSDRGIDGDNQRSASADSATPSRGKLDAKTSESARAAQNRDEGTATSGKGVNAGIRRSVLESDSARPSRSDEGVALRSTPDKTRLAPNGKPSNLNEFQWKQVRTPEFKEFFGDWENDPENASKVVDENGEPLVVYHGQPVQNSEIEVFKPGYWPKAVWLTSDTDLAGDFAVRYGSRKANGESGPVYPVYARIENPMVIDAKGASWDSIPVSPSIANEYGQATQSTDGLVEIAQEKGHDGLIVKNVVEGHTFSGEPATIQAVFEPTQIKSAIGNRGTFDPAAPSILRKLRNADDLADLEKLAQAKDFRPIMTALQTSVLEDANGANILSLDNNETSELFRTALAIYEDKDRADVTIFDGLYLNKNQTQGMLDTLEGMRDAAVEKKIDTKALDAVIKNFEEATRANGRVRLETFENARRHETIHMQSDIGSDGKSYKDRYANADEIASSPAFKKFHEALDKLQGKSNIGVALEEALAYLGDGDYSRFGLTKDEAKQILKQLIVGYAEANGLESLSAFDHTELYEEIESFRQSQSSEVGNDTRSGVDTERKARPRPAGQETRRDADGKGEEARKEKLRSLPNTLREAGVDAVDEAYNVFGNQDAIEAANNLIADLGLEKAIKTLEASTTYDKTHAVMSFMLQRALRNEAAIAEQNGDAEYAQKLRDRGLELASRHAQLATQAGQFTQAAAMVADAVESVIYHAEKIAQKRGKPLTPVEYETFEKLGVQVENQSTDLTRLRKDIRNLKAQIKRLQDAKPRIVGTRVNKKAIAKAQATLPDMTALIKQIREGLRDADTALRMVAWHGSPHVFDKFSLDKVGTGEGAQAYGYGLYFAGAESVADYYKQELSKKQPNGIQLPDGTVLKTWDDLKKFQPSEVENTAARALMFRGDFDEAVSKLYDDASIVLPEDAEVYRDAAAQVIKWQKSGAKLDPNKGAKYRVNLAPAEDEYLLWDKPLSEQSEKVKKALADGIPREAKERYAEILKRLEVLDKNGEINSNEASQLVTESSKLNNKYPLLHQIAALLKGENWPAKGKSLYQEMGVRLKGDVAASEYLKSLGIRGIKYLDGTSRGKGEGSYNYVIFDDADVEIQEVLRSTPDITRERLIQYGAAMMLDKPLSEISREQFADDIRKTFGNKVDDMLPQLFGESFNLRQEMLIKAKNELAMESLKAEFPDKSDAEIKAELKKRENERKERRDKGALAKKLARLYEPTVSKQKQDVIDVVNDIADPVVADYAEKIITNEVRPVARADRKLYTDAMTAIRDAHRILRDEELVRKQTLVGSAKALRDLEREEFLKRDEKRTTEKALARAYRRLDENPLVFYGKELLKILGESRSILASGDLSGSLRQGFYSSVTNPLMNLKGSENLPSSYGTMIKAITNKEAFADRMKAVENHPDFDIMKQMGVEFAEAGGGVAEENIRTEYLKAVPIVKNWLNLSERTYAGFLDVQRALWAESVINELRAEDISFRDNPEVYKAAGALINIATGRGNIGRGKLKAAIEAFGGVFFAPRFVVSRAQLLGHVFGGMATLPPGLRKIEAKRAARFHTAISLPMLALIAAGIVAVDPDDDDFLKIRVGDKARYEVTGGLQQYIKLIAQLGMTVKNVVAGDQTLKAGTKTAVNKGYYFGVKKLAPVPSYINAALTGKEPDTTEFNWLAGIGKRLTPITVREIGGAAVEDGVVGAALTLPTLFGIGVGYYQDKMKKAGSVDAMLNGPEVKRMTTDDLVTLLKEDYETPADKRKVEMVLKKKALAARKAGTLTQKEVDNIKKVLPDFNITARDTKKK